MQAKKKKRGPKFAENKAAFDSTMAAYRELSSFVGVRAMQYGDNSGGGGARNPAKPTPLDFRIDVDKVIKKCTKEIGRARFDKAYVEFDSEDPIEMEIRAQEILGEMRHGLEQGIGAEFIKRKISPTRKYFHVVRGCGPEHVIVERNDLKPTLRKPKPKVVQAEPEPEQEQELEPEATWAGQAPDPVALALATIECMSDPFDFQTQGLEFDDLDYAATAGND